MTKVTLQGFQTRLQTSYLLSQLNLINQVISTQCAYGLIGESKISFSNQFNNFLTIPKLQPTLQLFLKSQK